MNGLLIVLAILLYLLSGCAVFELFHETEKHPADKRNPKRVAILAFGSFTLSILCLVVLFINIRYS